MSQPTRKKERYTGIREIQGVDGMITQEISGMIQCHQNHYKPPGDIDF
jgi:hypothetical protein